MLTHDNYDNLYVYQVARATASKHQMPDLRRPWYMVTVKDGDNDHLVISDIDSMLHWVPVLVEGAELKLGAVRTIQLDYEPCGMCVTSIGRLVVCDPDTNRLYKYSSDCQCLGLPNGG